MHTSSPKICALNLILPKSGSRTQGAGIRERAGKRGRRHGDNAGTVIHNRIMHNEVMHRDAAGLELVVVLEHLVTLMRQVSVAGGLSTAASSALNRLGRDGPHRLTDLANAQGVSQPGMTQLVTRMEREGLVRRTANTGDRRGVVVEATEAGLDLVQRRRAERAEALGHMLRRLDPQDQTAIAAALPALARLVEARQPH
jgi:DNA-binding MarR family transcriptional regulator